MQYSVYISGFKLTILESNDQHSRFVPLSTVQSIIACRYDFETVSVNIHFVTLFGSNRSHVYRKCIRTAAAQLYDFWFFRFGSFLQRNCSLQIA